MQLIQGFRFEVTISPIVAGEPKTLHFQRVSGLEVSLETKPVGGPLNRLINTQLPQRLNYSNLVLERGMAVEEEVTEMDFENLFMAFMPAPSNLLISLVSEAGEPVKSWSLLGAYPVKWSFSDFDASSSEVVIQKMEWTYTILRPMAL